MDLRDLAVVAIFALVMGCAAANWGYQKFFRPVIHRPPKGMLYLAQPPAMLLYLPFFRPGARIIKD